MPKRNPLADYPHLEFKPCWQLTTNTAKNLGRCAAYIEALSRLPIPPDAQRELRSVAFERGAQATTRIEGNTLTDTEFQQLLAGKELPASRQYQAREVKNALDAMNDIWGKIITDGDRALITPQLLCDWNRTIGKELGPLYDGIPGRFRSDRRHVGRYLAPPPEDVLQFVEELCEWLRKHFQFGHQSLSIEDAIIQAIVSHVYFEWIHPFADGNGRTGRLLEFYVLLRAGFPDITVHVLANHYNQSRDEYTSHFDNARNKRSLTEFIDYAVQGLSDGLAATLQTVQVETFKIAWESHVYRVFDGYTDYKKKPVFKRRRALALAMPISDSFTAFQLVRSSDFLTSEYMNHDKRMLNNDLQILLELELMTHFGEPANENFKANTAPMLSGHFSSRVAGVLPGDTDTFA